MTCVTSGNLLLASLLWALVGSMTPLSAQTVPADSGPELQIGVETRRDRLHYHFDNPSSFDTPFTVPHFFEQRYVADNLWVASTIRYRMHFRWETSIAATPVRDAIGDDYDTFFDPFDTVWRSGTTGPISIRSFQVSQIGELARAGAVRLSGGYRFRQDHADFGVGHKTVTQNGVTVSAYDVTSPETTSSQVHEVLVGLTMTRALTERWLFGVSGDVAPTAVGRLAIALPEKYPGQTLVFNARMLAASARASLMRRRAAWPVELSVDVGRTWSYQPTARLSRDLFGVRIAVGRMW